MIDRRSMGKVERFIYAPHRVGFDAKAFRESVRGMVGCKRVLRRSLEK